MLFEAWRDPAASTRRDLMGGGWPEPSPLPQPPCQGANSALQIFLIGADAKNPLPKAPPACGLVKTPRGVLASVTVGNGSPQPFCPVARRGSQPIPRCCWSASSEGSSGR